ncbi:hypothetical protein DFH06DRAFT_770088 [Mycena polygramma]|nr:hypothetical protein DFH06DRAFT_770088 [Mycena polygramma]
MFSNFFHPALALLALSTTVYSQSALSYDPAPFSFIGQIDGLSLDAGGDVFAGGTITVDGFKITVPKNTLVTLPSITVAWSELFQNNQPQLPLLGSVTWEATVFGNNVNGEKIAGLIYIVQESAQVLQGFITSMDVNGHFVVDRTLDCVLNDPTGTYGPAYTANPLWSVDPTNPSVRASTGYPVCIPRSATDPDCPKTNRPVDAAGNYKTTWTYPAPGSGALNPKIMAPLAVGDYITFSGIKTDGGSFAIYSLEANLGIYTTPGTKPAYLTVEEVNYAVPDPIAGVEIAETRAVVFTTDQTTTVNWFAIDVDPCTGAVTERALGSPTQGSAVAPIGKIVYRLGKTPAGAPPRQVGFRYSSYGSVTEVGPRGVAEGGFTQPIFNFIFPEILNFGAKQIPLEFDAIPFLAQGGGPFAFGNPLTTPLDTPGPVVGQLSPWPGRPTPKAVVCPATPAAGTGAGTTTGTTTGAGTGTAPGTGTTAEKITIISASTLKKQGVSTTTATARSDTKGAQLFMALSGVDAVGPQKMTQQANGQFTLSINTKSKPASVTISSSAGGKPVTQAV